MNSIPNMTSVFGEAADAGGELWNELRRRPKDKGVISVLADRLLEKGDADGEAISAALHRGVQDGAVTAFVIGARKELEKVAEQDVRTGSERRGKALGAHYEWDDAGVRQFVESNMKFWKKIQMFFKRVSASKSLDELLRRLNILIRDVSAFTDEARLGPLWENEHALAAKGWLEEAVDIGPRVKLDRNRRGGEENL